MTFRAFAPGRVNLIGEHTDYNGGLALPFGIAEGVRVEARAASGDRIEVGALGEHDEFGLGAIAPAGGWRAYVRGAVAELAAAGVEPPGALLTITADLPMGAGLSSSAAVVLAVCLAVCALAEEEPPEDLPRIAQRVEREWAGADTGLLDQLAILGARPGCALRIDFRDESTRSVALELGDWRLGLADSGVRHSHATGKYAERREECRRACETLGIEHLVDADPSELPAPLDTRARHVVEESARVDRMVEALARGDLDAAGALLDESHASLRDLYDASVPEVEATVARLKSAGAAGARMTGGGWGGSVLGLFGSGIELPDDVREVRPGAGVRVS